MAVKKRIKMNADGKRKGGAAAKAADLRREFRRLLRNMDFLSRHPSLDRSGPEGERIADIYQQLGALWEFFALQCGHRAGWRKARDDKVACRLCGTIRGVAERWILLPQHGRKTVGRKQLPNSSETFPSKKSATITDDTIEFHGAAVNVAVHNSYPSRLFRRHKVNIAADRIVRVHEDEIECWIDTNLVKLSVRRHQPGQRPPYGAVLSELPKRILKRFPLLIEYDGRDRLVGVTIFRADPARRRRTAMAKRPATRKPAVSVRKPETRSA